MSRVVFLTGASSGLGAALAPQLARRGDRVVVTARREDALRALAERIRAEGGEAMPIPLDVTDGDAVRAAVRRVEVEWGPVDVAIANAGIGDHTPAVPFDAAKFERIFRTNVLGAAYLYEAVIPGMVARRSGHLVGVTSLAAWRGLPGFGAYSASKAAFQTMLEALRVELRAHGVAVTDIVPGFVRTPLTDRNQFWMPFKMEADAAARSIVRAMDRRKRVHAFPWPMSVGMRAVSVVPNAIYDRVARVKKVGKAPEA